MCDYFLIEFLPVFCPNFGDQYGSFVMPLRIDVAEDGSAADAAPRVFTVAIWGTQTSATPLGQRVRVSRKPRFMLVAKTASLNRPL
jgi:hypothetical protein